MVLCREYYTVGSAADHICDFIALIDDDLFETDFKLSFPAHGRRQALSLSLVPMKGTRGHHIVLLSLLLTLGLSIGIPSFLLIILVLNGLLHIVRFHHVLIKIDLFEISLQINRLEFD